MTLNELLENLRAMPPQAPLIFSTLSGPINGGYHVTELKLAQVKSIDCAARRGEWSEAMLQLLDGDGGAHMSVGKFTAIVGQSVKTLDGLGDVGARVEYARGNAGMHAYDISAPALKGESVEISLAEVTAVCKPAQDLSMKAAASACCG